MATQEADLKVPIPEIAARLGCSRQRVYGYFQAGKIPAERQGRLWVVWRAEFDHWLAKLGGKEVEQDSPLGFDPEAFLTALEDREMVFHLGDFTVTAQIQRRDAKR